MHYPCVIVCEDGHRLINLLRRDGGERCWVLREISSFSEVKRSIATGSTAVLVVSLNSTRKAGWELLAWLTEQSGTTSVVAVLDEEFSEAANLAWDLGACHVVPAHRLNYELSPVVRSLVTTRWMEADDSAVTGSR